MSLCLLLFSHQSHHTPLQNPGADEDEDDPEDGGWVPEGAAPEESDEDEDEDEDDAPAPELAAGDKGKKKRPRESDTIEDTTKKTKT
jgi:hypothetical protein